MCIHAEINALNKKLKRLKRTRMRKIKVDLYVAKYIKCGNTTNSKPCYNCTIELKKNKYVTVDNVYYTIGDNKILKMKFDDFCKETIPHFSRGYKTRKEKHK